MTDSICLEEVFERIAREYLPEVTKIEWEPGDGGPGFVAHLPSGALVGEAKHSKTASIDSVLGLFACGALRAQRIADRSSRTPFVLVVVPRVGPKTRYAVERFMSENAPACGWALADQTGTTRIAVPSLGIDADHHEFAPVPRWQRRGPVRLFSDLNRWMLKILLLADAPPHFWNGPRDPVATPTDLHRVAKVSVAKAHQFCDAVEKSGYLDVRFVSSWPVRPRFGCKGAAGTEVVRRSWGVG
ncbi:MAG: hypothetical protein GXX96_38790 [Planctomycetaceae bacterium]|nr:hypothetical protein [Planctomycetaceae bacterium]